MGLEVSVEQEHLAVEGVLCSGDWSLWIWGYLTPSFPSGPSERKCFIMQGRRLLMTRDPDLWARLLEIWTGSTFSPFFLRKVVFGHCSCQIFSRKRGERGRKSLFYTLSLSVSASEAEESFGRKWTEGSLAA